MPAPPHAFLLGYDYHLGDLLWFTAVLAEYRRQRTPGRVVVALPDRGISRILEHNPLIDDLMYLQDGEATPAVRERYGSTLVVHDLRPWSLGRAMIDRRRERLPWLYYRDLWTQPRGQWLATFLGLGRLHNFQPILHLTEQDRMAARELPEPFVLLAPHVGHYGIPMAGRLWHAIKGWPAERWIQLARAVRARGSEPLTLGATGQSAIPGTQALLGLPIRQVAGVIERGAALVTVESGLWFIAAARRTPFVILPWWLPRSINWPAPMQVPHRLIYRDAASVAEVAAALEDLLGNAPREIIERRAAGSSRLPWEQDMPNRHSSEP
jgi:hypothetical protein